MLILPLLGCSRPATERSSVVLPLPDAPSNATTSPGLSVSETPFRIWVSPYCRCRSSTTSSFMEADSEAQRDGKADGDQRDIDERQRGDLVDRAGTPQRNEHRSDDFGALTEEIHGGRMFALEDHEHEQPARQQPEADQRNGNVGENAPARCTGGARRFFELGPDLQERAGDEPHPVRQ